MPADLAIPNGCWNGLDQRAQGGSVVDLLTMALRQFGELVFDAAHLAQPQDGASADHLAFGFDDTIGERRTVIAKPTPRARSASTERSMYRAASRREPSSKREHVLGIIGPVTSADRR